MHTDPFVTIAFFALVLIISAIFVGMADRYLSWRDFDRYRRLSRRAHRNLVRGLR